MNTPHGLLWIKGHPGTGKSTLMAYIHRHLRSQSTFATIRLDFFFMGRGSPLQRSPLGLFRSLLWQVYGLSGVAREIIFGVYEEKMGSFGGGEWEWKVEELRELFKIVVSEVSKKTEVMIFVDALDEAVLENGEKAALSLVEFFYSLNALNTTDSGQEGGVKGVRICISCRHYPVVGSLGPGLEIHLEEENTKDLQHYIRDTLHTGVQGWDGEPQALTAKLVDAVSEKAAGVFQWAVLRVPKIIRSLNDGEVTVEEITRLVADESNELFSLYTSIFRFDISPYLREKAILFLQWIFLALRPLSLPEVRFALACDDESQPFSQDCCAVTSKTFISTDSQMAKLVKSLSGGLAKVWERDGGVTSIGFIHGSVNDFLHHGGLSVLSNQDVKIPAKGDSEMIGSYQNRLTWSCINYLRLVPVQDAIKTWLLYDDKIPIFISYVARYLFQHVSRAEHHGKAQRNIAFFFESHPEVLGTWQKTCWKLGGERVYSASKFLLHLGAVYQIPSFIQNSLSREISLETQDEDGHTALSLVAKRGDEELTRRFLDLGVDVNTRSCEGTTALELAAANSHEVVVKLLLEKGATMESEPGKNPRSALQAAISGGRLSLVRILINSGADINTHHAYHGTPLQEAAGLRSDEMAIFLLQRGAEINTPCGRHGSALQAAAFRGHRALIRVLLAQGADVNFQGGEYGNALQAAAIYGMQHLDIVELLLEHGADVNAIGGAYGTALQAVLFPGNEELIRLLLDHGADVNIQVGEFGCAVMSAAMSGDERIVRLLVERGVDIHTAAGEYGNVLQAAVLSGNGRLVEYFLDLGVDVDTRCGKYGTALQAAVVCKPDLVGMLLKWKANVNIPGLEYGNPLYAAVALKRKGLIRKLLESGADVNMKVEKHISSMLPTVLQMAASSKGDTEVLKQILEFGADINAIDGSYGTALKVAATFGYKDMVEILLDSGADINLNEGFNGTALRAAAVKGHREVVELLVRKGADSNPEDDALTIISKARGGQRQVPSHY